MENQSVSPTAEPKGIRGGVFSFRTPTEAALYTFRRASKALRTFSFYNSVDQTVLKSILDSTEWPSIDCLKKKFGIITTKEVFRCLKDLEKVANGAVCLEIIRSHSSLDLEFLDILSRAYEIETLSGEDLISTDFTAQEEEVSVMVTSHFQLLLNRRDPLALARMLLLGDRKAFSALRKLARKEQEPLCQTAVSHVLRVGLGRKDDGPLAPHTPHLQEFVATLNQLQTILEDNNCFLDCMSELVRVIRKRLLLQSPSSEFAAAVSKSCQRMLDSAPVLVANQRLAQNLFQPTPLPNTSEGGSMAGRWNVPLIQAAVDRETCWVRSLVASSSTPSRQSSQASLFAFFQSPEVSTESSPQLPSKEPSPLASVQNKIDQEPFKLASFLNEDSPLEVKKLDGERVADEDLRGKENIPPSAPVPSRTPKRKSQKTDKLRKKNLMRTFGKRTKSLSKGQTSITQFLLRT